MARQEPSGRRGRIKRTHRKSRLGCITCKLRRVKCDEGRPCCENCERRGIACAYEGEATGSSPTTLWDTPPQLVRTPGSLGSPNSSTGDALPSPIHACSEPLGLGATELAEHYLDHTVNRFAQTGMCPEQLRVWQVTVPALAYSFETVREGMLTLAAICLHYDSQQTPEYAARCLEVAEEHGKKFVHGSLELVSAMDVSKKDSILACSRILCVLGFAFYGVHRRNGVTLSHSAAWTWIHLLRGVKPVHDAIYEFGYRPSHVFVDDLVSSAPPSLGLIDLEPGQSAAPPHTQDPRLHFLQECHQERFQKLRAIARNRRHLQDDEEFNSMICAIDVLQEVATHMCFAPQPDLFRLTCAWPSQLPQTFFEALMAGDPLSLAIYAHWLMVVTLVEDLWWVNDMGRAVIGEIVVMCSTADADVQELLHWPRRTLRFA